MMFEVAWPHLSFFAACSRHVVISFGGLGLTSAGKRRPAVSKVDDRFRQQSCAHAAASPGRAIPNADYQSRSPNCRGRTGLATPARRVGIAASLPAVGLPLVRGGVSATL